MFSGFAISRSLSVTQAGRGLVGAVGEGAAVNTTVALQVTYLASGTHGRAPYQDDYPVNHNTGTHHNRV